MWQVYAWSASSLFTDVREQDTINTHKGLYRCSRLLYGVASAPAIWQREIENILADIPGVSVFLDDIRITGPDDDTHLHRLELVLQRLQQFNIKINEEKCEFFQNEIRYCGYVIDKDGIHKEKRKMDAIDKMPRPLNQSELRSFIGMINYYGKFINNLSTLLYPLNRLLCKDVPFKWTCECEKAFELAKREFKSDTILAHYDCHWSWQRTLVLTVWVQYYHSYIRTARKRYYSTHHKR